KSPQFAAPKAWVCTNASDNKSTNCTTPIPIPNVIGPTSITSCFGTQEGVVYLGTLTLQQDYVPADIQSVSIAPLGFQVAGSCSTGFSGRISADISINFGSSAPNGTAGPAQICKATILGDTLS